MSAQDKVDKALARLNQEKLRCRYGALDKSAHGRRRQYGSHIRQVPSYYN